MRDQGSVRLWAGSARGARNLEELAFWPILSTMRKAKDQLPRGQTAKHAKTSTANEPTADLPKQVFANDRPIVLPEEDRLNRLPFAKRIANAIVNRPDQAG